MQEKTVSVIVPVYNGQKFLVPCMESMLKQTLQNMEVIFVNDCSTDKTYDILKTVESKFPDRISVISCNENHGAGGARNLGIEVAQGEYLGFMDVDDVVVPNMFEKMYEEAKRGDYDIVDCGFYNEAKDNAIIFTSDGLTGILDDKKRSELIVSGGYLWSKIFRKSFWMSQNLIMREHVILEDSEIIAKAFATAKSIGNVKEILYCYKSHQMSLSKQQEPEKYFINTYAAMRAIYTQLSKLDNYEGIRCAVEYEMIQMYSYSINMLLKAYLEKDNYDPLASLTEIADYRKRYISSGYENMYVRNKIEELDIQIMELNDRDPMELCKRVKRGTL